jgi:hypothetical protein
MAQSHRHLIEKAREQERLSTLRNDISQKQFFGFIQLIYIKLNLRANCSLDDDLKLRANCSPGTKPFPLKTSGYSCPSIIRCLGIQMVGSCNDSKVLLAPINNTAGHKDRRHRRVVAETGAGSAALAPAGPLLRVYVINSHALCGSTLRSPNQIVEGLIRRYLLWAGH